MRSRKVVLGSTVLALLAAVAAVGLVTGQEVVAGIAVVLLLLAIGVLVLDAATTLRRNERQLLRLTKAVRAAARAKPAVAPAPAARGTSVGPPAGESDLLGTIRLLQAQYVGRLDRAQATLEAAAERLSAADGGE